MEAKFSPRVKDVISFSKEALRLGHEYVGTEHLLLGIIREGEGVAIKLLKALAVDTVKLRRMVEHVIKRSKTTVANSSESISLVKQAERALKITYLEAKLFKSNKIGTEHLLLAILKDDDNVVTQVLSQLGVDYDAVKEELEVSNAMPEAEFPGSSTMMMTTMMHSAQEGVKGRLTPRQRPQFWIILDGTSPKWPKRTN